jgi:hypothetical protein
MKRHTHSRKVTRRKPSLGSGARFRKLKASLARRPGVRNPGGLAAAIGRRKYGSAKMSKMSSAGRKRRSKRRR